jgi:hypothetical protein
MDTGKSCRQPVSTPGNHYRLHFQYQHYQHACTAWAQPCEQERSLHVPTGRHTSSAVSKRALLPHSMLRHRKLAAALQLSPKPKENSVL